MAILSKNTTIGGKKPLLISNNSTSKNINLNDYTKEGNYIFNNLETATNFPNGYDWINENASHLQVISFDKDDSSKVMQILTKYNSNKLFVRYSYLNNSNVIWSTWNFIGDSSGGSEYDISEIINYVDKLYYYDDINITPSAESYFIVNETGETIIGLTDDGVNQTELVIPYKINGKLITAIEEHSFRKKIDEETIEDNTLLKNVVIPNSITSIGGASFMGCTSLISINMPNSVTSIEHAAFEGCTSLSSINIPNGITTIESETYLGTSLSSITIPNSVTSIRGGAFADCTPLKSIVIPNSVTNIEEGAFYKCTNLKIYCEQGSYAETYAKTKNIPVVYTDVSDIATETELERLKYYGDKDIIPSDESYFTINETGETIIGLTDEGKTQSNLVIPYKINGKLITGIYSYAFAERSSLINIIIPYSITSIDEGAFDSCTSLTSITIPDSVTFIGIAIFNRCTSLKSIYISSGVTDIPLGAFNGCSLLTSISIPNSVRCISGEAFGYCTSLASLSIPNSVTSIEHAAFEDCSSLTSITIPNSVTEIAITAFEGCTNLTIYCEPGSYAETYATENNISVMYTDISKIVIENKADKQTSAGGFIGGNGASAKMGAAIGHSASATTGGAIGYGANVGNGFAGGYLAKAQDESEAGIDAIQLGTGTNNTPKTFQVYDYPMMDADGNIPLERLTNAPKTEVVDNLTSTDTDKALSANQGKMLNDGKADKQNSNGGFSGGEGSSSTYGGAIGAHAEATTGGAVGEGAAASAGGGAVGSGATSESGGAVGLVADSSEGGAIGFEARTSNGFAGGKSAQTIDANENPIDAIQLGSGINYAPKSFQVYTYQMMSADGTIPADRLVNAPKTEVIDNLTSTDTTKALSAAQGKVLALADERLKYYGDKDITPSSESWFTVNETGETITGLKDEGKTEPNIVIPYKINDVLITNIAEAAFMDCQNIISVIMPCSITSIGDSTFFGCNSLTSIIIPDSITRIGSSVFYNCRSLTSVNIANNVTSIGESAFYYCNSLTSVTIPDSVTVIDYNAFAYCSNLTSIFIPKSVTSIGDDIFAECSNLTIYCEQGSYAETYAKANNIPIVYTNISDNSINKITELEKLIDNLHYYCNKNIVINTTCFYTEQNEEGTGNFVLNTDNLTDTTLVIPYTLYSEYWIAIDGIEMANCNITGSLNVEKIIIPRGMEFKNPLTSEVWTDELLITLLPNLKTIVRIHEDGAVISYNIAEKSIN